jgi:hypothetical protein
MLRQLLYSKRFGQKKSLPDYYFLFYHQNMLYRFDSFAAGIRTGSGFFTWYKKDCASGAQPFKNRYLKRIVMMKDSLR